MPSGVYKRTEEHCKINSEAHLRSPKALEASRRNARKMGLKYGHWVGKLPKTQAQIEASRKNGRKMGLACGGFPATEKVKEAARENIKKAIKVACLLPRTEKQLEASRENIKTAQKVANGLPRSVAQKAPRIKEIRRKQRIAALNRIQKQIGEGGQIQPRYSSQACKYFETVNKRAAERGWPLGQHATDGGEFHIKELGYFLDYFNPGLKLIIEWDESHHYNENGNLRSEDIQRQEEIQELYPDFRFIRLKQ